MCGITGIYNFDRSEPVDATALQRMTAVIRHRGPNGQGLYTDRNVGLGHRRLSVIDLDGGGQPMSDAASQRTIVYNGEIFNYRELRHELGAAGTRLRTKSDTEVLLHLATPAVAEWIGRVNGMFAFALWDARSRSLLVVRDRFGVKPLYYVATPRCFAFASEIKSLLQLPGVQRQLDHETVAEYVSFRHVLEPRTMFTGIRQLPAGHFIHLREGMSSVEPVRYWDETQALADPRIPSYPDTPFTEIFESAVTARLVSDVPLGTYNSGGVDSSLVTREVRRHRSNHLHTFSIGFSESSHDESRYAQEVASTLGTIHHAESLAPAQYAALLPRAIWHHDEPLCHPHSVHLMHLSAVASRLVTVVLTGEGADEVFGGYPRIRIPLLAASLGASAKPLAMLAGYFGRAAGYRKLIKLAQALTSPHGAEIDVHRFIGLDDLERLCRSANTVGERANVRRNIDPRQSLIEQLLEYERRSYMQSLLVRLDKMSMAHGLEARTPFLDYRLVVWSKRLPRREKTGLGWSNKPILKREAVKRFSSDLVYRPKVGFGVPLAQWFRQEPSFKEHLAQLTSPASLVSELFPRHEIERLVSEHAQGRSDHAESLWILLNLHLWADSVLRVVDEPADAESQYQPCLPLSEV